MADFPLFTCEHGGNRVPAEYRRLFAGHRGLLQTHRGYDPGALDLARACSRRNQAHLHQATVTRLLVELNRSQHHPSLFSKITRPLDAEARRSIIAKYYQPYREAVETQVAGAIAGGRRVLHVSFHTFTPKLDGDVRRADVGLLYDPARGGEVAFINLLGRQLQEARPDFVIRRNYPYLGKGDGFTTSLRKRWPADWYVGVELEVNQRWPLGESQLWRRIKIDLAAALEKSLHAFASPRSGE